MEEIDVAQKNQAAGSAIGLAAEVPGPVRFERRGAVRSVTLDRPRARNALDIETTASIANAIPSIARDADNYAIILRSIAPCVFCACGDIGELARLTRCDIRPPLQAIASDVSPAWLL